MIYGNVELLNVAETVEVPDRLGVRLQRVPEAVRQQLRERSQMQLRRAAGVEVRFVNDWQPAKITLMSYTDVPIQVCAYIGDFYFGSWTLTEEQAVTIELELPESHFLRKDEFDDSSCLFKRGVWRLLCQGGEVHLIDVQGESIRPPARSEVPPLRYLAYGTSITQGASATHPALTYVKQTAWRLRADAINLGVGGSAFCEKELADYMAGRDDWDFATLCLSVNMLAQGVSTAEFRERASYLIGQLAEKHRGKPIACISLFPSYFDLNIPIESDMTSSPEEYRSTLQELAEKHKVQYIDGRELLSMNGLTRDLLHPSDYGMIEIAENLSKRLAPLLANA